MLAARIPGPMIARGVYFSILRGAFVGVLCLLLAGGSAARAASGTNDPALPKPVPANRYDVLAAVSPFAPPTAAPAPVAQPPPPPQPSWAEAWLLSTATDLGAGQYRVTLAKRKAGEGKGNDRVIITTGQENPESIAIAGVQWSDKPEQTRITLNRSGVFAVFTFDPSALNAQGTGGGGAAMMGKFPGAGLNVPPPMPANRPGMPTPAQITPFNPGAEQGLQPPPPPPAMNVPGRAQLDDLAPQRAGMRTAPIPAAPQTTPPQGRVFRPPGAPSSLRPQPALPGSQPDEEDL